MQAATAQHQIAAERERGEQQRKTDSARSQQHAQMKQYEDELARKRYNSEHEQTRQRNAEMVQMQEEASRRQETARRQTEESIQQSRRETDRRKAEHERELIRAKSISDAEGRIAENRANEDVIRRQMVAKVEAETGKAMALLREFSSFVGGGFDALLTDERRGYRAGGWSDRAGGGGLRRARGRADGVPGPREVPRPTELGARDLAQRLRLPPERRQGGGRERLQNRRERRFHSGRRRRSRRRRARCQARDEGPAFGDGHRQHARERRALPQRDVVRTPGDGQDDDGQASGSALRSGLRFDDRRRRRAARVGRGDAHPRALRLGLDV